MLLCARLPSKALTTSLPLSPNIHLCRELCHESRGSAEHSPQAGKLGLFKQISDQNTRSNHDAGSGIYLEEGIPMAGQQRVRLWLVLAIQCVHPKLVFLQKRGPCMRPMHIQDTVTAMPPGWLLKYFCLSQAAPEPPMIPGMTLLQVH